MTTVCEYMTVLWLPAGKVKVDDMAAPVGPHLSRPDGRGQVARNAGTSRHEENKEHVKQVLKSLPRVASHYKVAASASQRYLLRSTNMPSQSTNLP